MSLSKHSIRTLVLALCSVFLAASAHAQFKASIQGTVMDPQGNAVANATVTITNQDTGVVRTTVTSTEGFYRASELPPGKYTVTIEATGFKKSTTNDVAVEAEQPRGFDVTLTVGNIQESVTVT